MFQDKHGTAVMDLDAKPLPGIICAGGGEDGCDHGDHSADSDADSADTDSGSTK